jgi:beta-lactamase class A
MHMERRPQRSLLKASVAGFVLGAVMAGLCTYFFFLPSSQMPRVVRESDFASSTGYEFTDPLITVSTGSANSPDYAALQAQVQDYLNKQEQTGGLASASVRFSDIEATESFTINPDEEYDPASLTKIPLAMAYYDLAESDPSVLSQTIYYSGTPDLDANEQIESSTQLTPGQTYTVEEMIEHMIKYSDNNAEQLLADHLSQIGQLNVLSTLYDDLGIEPDTSTPDNTTVGSYSLFLRVLFNATYLDRDYSEQLLQLLSEGDFAQGIRAGVPSSVPVAEKFGDARIPNAQGVQVGAELQNCGIIYYPDHPYILCIMTKGASVADLEQTIAGVSKLIYQNVSAHYPQG